jgi:hypothetical protein
MTSVFKELFGESPFLQDTQIPDYEDYLDSLLAVLDNNCENHDPSPASVLDNNCENHDPSPASRKKCAGGIKLKEE